MTKGASTGPFHPRFYATLAKSHHQLVKEQEVRLRLELEDKLGLWASLFEGQEEKKPQG
jgi:hypothetical protein